jgi:membrane protein implicated in regulation of membrane protease activity
MPKEPDFNQDLELFKLSQLAESYRSDYLTGLGFCFTAIITATVVAVEAGLKLPPWANLVFFVIMAGIILVLFIPIIHFRLTKPYKKKLKRLSERIKKVENRQTIGDFDSILNEKE